MRLVRAADLVRTPWKNGGGTTAEIAAYPPGSDLDGFDWRLSMADVASDGPFSVFPGIDRTLILIQGEGLDLVIDGAPRRLSPASPVIGFTGEATTVARLVAGPIRDVNVMTRRDKVRHKASIGDPGRHTDVAALVALNGPTTVRANGRTFMLQQFDTVLAEATAGIAIATDRRVLLVRGLAQDLEAGKDTAPTRRGA